MRSGELRPYLKAEASASLVSGQETWVPQGWPARLVPNFSDWHPGDIVLVTAEKTLAGGGIVLGQAVTFNLATVPGARYSHAAIYVGDGLIVDATFNNPIKVRSVWEYCRHRALALRRVPIDNADAIATYALAHLGEPYSAAAVARSKLIPKTVPDRRRLYCSTLVGLVVAEATDIQLASEWRHRPLQPATLATHPDLSIVDCGWRRVAGPGDLRRDARAFQKANALKPHVVPTASGTSLVRVPTRPPHPMIPPV